MSVRESIVRAFLKLNIFARTPEVEKSGLISEEALDHTSKPTLEHNISKPDYEEELEDNVSVRVYRGRNE